MLNGRDRELIEYASEIRKRAKFRAGAAAAPVRDVWSECDFFTGSKLMLCRLAVLLPYAWGCRLGISTHDCAAASEAIAR